MLPGNSSLFRMLLPNEFLVDPVKKKYARILRDKRMYYTSPIEFLNESLQRVELLGFNGATITQQQTGSQRPWFDQSRIQQNNLQGGVTEFVYRSGQNPLSIIDKVINVEFRHTLGYLNYFMLFENFWYVYSRDMATKKWHELVHQLNVDILNEIGERYCRVVLYDPVMDNMDMLSLDHTQPVAQNSSFHISFKYSNFDFEFL